MSHTEVSYQSSRSKITSREVYLLNVIDVNDQPDETGFQGTFKYLQDLEVDLENASSLIPLEVVQSPALGVMKKQAFIEGWMKAT